MWILIVCMFDEDSMDDIETYYGPFSSKEEANVYCDKLEIKDHERLNWTSVQPLINPHTIYRVYTLTNCVWENGEPKNSNRQLIYDGAGVVIKDYKGDAIRYLNDCYKEDGHQFRLVSATIDSRPLNKEDDRLMMSVPV